jgi:hypothetical protein
MTTLTPSRVEDDTAYVEVPRVLDNLIVARITVHHGLHTGSPHIRSYTAAGDQRGVAYFTVLDEDTVEVTVSDDTAYVEVSR